MTIALAGARQRCLEKLKSTMDGLEIPPEVLASLPSVDQIQAKAARSPTQCSGKPWPCRPLKNTSNP